MALAASSSGLASKTSGLARAFRPAAPADASLRGGSCAGSYTGSCRLSVPSNAATNLSSHSSAASAQDMPSPRYPQVDVSSRNSPTQRQRPSQATPALASELRSSHGAGLSIPKRPSQLNQEPQLASGGGAKRKGESLSGRPKASSSKLRVAVDIDEGTALRRRRARPWHPPASI